jgi:hypothetical protein
MNTQDLEINTAKKLKSNWAKTQRLRKKIIAQKNYKKLVNLTYSKT